MPFRSIFFYQNTLKCHFGPLKKHQNASKIVYVAIRHIDDFRGILRHFGGSLGHNARAELWSQSTHGLKRCRSLKLRAPPAQGPLGLGPTDPLEDPPLITLYLAV